MKGVSMAKYTKEFKEDAIKLVLEEGYGSNEAGRRLDVPSSTIRDWVDKASIKDDCDGETRSKKELLAEIKKLKKEAKNLQMERDILKKATAFFAKESK
jgi:transposase